MVSGYTCPVCGYPDLYEPVRPPDRSQTYEICSSCGFEFGVTDDDEGETYESWRAKWVAGGMKWWSRSDSRRPAGWDPRAQLASLRAQD